MKFVLPRRRPPVLCGARIVLISRPGRSCDLTITANDVSKKNIAQILAHVRRLEGRA